MQILFDKYIFDIIIKNEFIWWYLMKFKRSGKASYCIVVRRVVCLCLGCAQCNKRRKLSGSAKPKQADDEKQ